MYINMRIVECYLPKKRYCKFKITVREFLGNPIQICTDNYIKCAYRVKLGVKIEQDD